MRYESIELIANISLALSFLAALVFGIVETRERVGTVAKDLHWKPFTTFKPVSLLRLALS